MHKVDTISLDDAAALLEEHRTTTLRRLGKELSFRRLKGDKGSYMLDRREVEKLAGRVLPQRQREREALEQKLRDAKAAVPS